MAPASLNRDRSATAQREDARGTLQSEGTM